MAPTVSVEAISGGIELPRDGETCSRCGALAVGAVSIVLSYAGRIEAARYASCGRHGDDEGGD